MSKSKPNPKSAAKSPARRPRPAAKSREDIPEEGAVVVENGRVVPPQTKAELQAIIDVYREQNPDKAAAKDKEFAKKLGALK